MSGCCDQDIHTLHAELTHKAREIQFQLAYTNGVDPAEIIVFTQKNVQGFIEELLGIAGIPVRREIPGGLKNNTNVTFTTAYEFIPGSLVVCLSGLDMIGVSSSLDKDYVELPDNQSFAFLIDPSKSHRLNCPPLQNEPLTVSYLRRVTYNTKGGT